MKLKVNVNKPDRTVRIVAAVLLIYVGFINTEIIANSTINILLSSLGFINLLASITGYCPVYQLAQLSTHAEKNDQK